MIVAEQIQGFIHTRPQAFTDPLAMLVHCHHKIERHIESLEQAAEVLHNRLDKERLAAFFAIDMARAHFAGPGVKHTEDEEQSLFPRLRLCGGDAGREALAAIAELEAEHRVAEHLHQSFEELAAKLPRDGSADSKEINQLNELIAAISSLYRPHMKVENELVFPVAERVLRPADIERIGDEMHGRRQVHLKRF
jgi:hemerythrin-like domain-containing protein